MKDIFFAYPGGLAGLALLLLRASIVCWLAITPLPATSNNWITIVTCLVALALSVGFSARAASGCFVIGLVVTGIVGQITLEAFAAPALDSLALALIGPGAYSIDAMIFGRRTMRLPG
jgi:hypothetical protein